jgi:hypothetical protein
MNFRNRCPEQFTGAGKAYPLQAFIPPPSSLNEIEFSKGRFFFLPMKFSFPRSGKKMFSFPATMKFDFSVTGLTFEETPLAHGEFTHQAISPDVSNLNR